MNYSINEALFRGDERFYWRSFLFVFGRKNRCNLGSTETETVIVCVCVWWWWRVPVAVIGNRIVNMLVVSFIDEVTNLMEVCATLINVLYILLCHTHTLKRTYIFIRRISLLLTIFPTEQTNRLKDEELLSIKQNNNKTPFSMKKINDSIHIILVVTFVSGNSFIAARNI